MIGSVLAGLSVGTGLLAAHPFTTYPASLWVLARHNTVPISLGELPKSIAVCVCAYNEEAVIGARIENLLRQRIRRPALEILVYVDAAEDNTLHVLERFGDAIRVVSATERRGKTYGMNCLVCLTAADVIVFSDANVMFADDAIEKLVAPFGDKTVGCTCGHLQYVDAAAETSTAITGSRYWRLEERVKALESETGSVMGADGSIFAVRRLLYAKPPEHLIDDMYVSLSILCDGYRIVRVADAIATEVSVSRAAEEFRRKVRIACQAFNVHRALWPRLRRLGPLDMYKYLSHKLLRWNIIYLLALCSTLMLFAIVTEMSAKVAIWAFLIFLLMCLGVVTANRGPLGTLREALMAFVATGVGIARALRGDTFQTWKPPASARAVMHAEARS